MQKGFKVKPNLKGNIAYFDSGLDVFEFSSNTKEPVVKKALVLVEGTHVDSNKRTHTFTPERLQKIVNNTNKFLARTRIPLLKDHQKKQDATIGDVSGNFVAKVITEEDLPDSKHLDLVGKLGVFATEVVVKGKKAIEDVASGLINTISPGIDVATDTIKEISATPIPAIAGMSLFTREAKFSALTLADALNAGEQDDAIKDEAYNLLDVLLSVLDNIAEAEDDELEGANPQELQVSAIEEFSKTLMELIGASPEAAPLSEEEEIQLQQLQMRQQLASGGIPGGQQPGFLQRQQGIQNNGQVQMNRNGKETFFTLADIEVSKYGAPLSDTAEFAEGQRKRGLGRKIAVGAAALGGAAVAGRYGFAAARGIGRGRNLNKAMGVAGKRRIGTLRSGMAGIKGAAKRDVAAVRSGLGRARQTVARTAYRAMGRKPNRVG